MVNIRTGAWGEESDGWPVYGVPPTGSGNRTVFPHSVPGKGVSAVQPGRSGGPVSLFNQLLTF